MQVDEYSRTTRAEQIRRSVCMSVLDAYMQTKSVLGTAGAIDYARITGGSGPKYSDNGKNLPLLDFVIDVDNAIDETLTKVEKAEHLEGLLEGHDKTVFTTEFMKIQERLGLQFLARSIYPVRQYFTTVKKARPANRV